MSNNKKIFIYLIFLSIFFSSFIKAEEIPYLLTASSKGDVEMVKAIIDSGGNPNSRDKDNITALMYASRKNQVEIVEYLISKGALINKTESKLIIHPILKESGL